MLRFILFGLLAFVAPGAFWFPLAQAGEVMDLFTTPVSDGDLQDTRKVWENDPNKISDLEMVALVGTSYGLLGAGIFEFSLPPKDKQPTGKLRSAKLIVSINSGEEANEGTLSPLDVDIYGYAGKSADGGVDFADWNEGESLGRWLTKDETLIGRGTPMPEFDVTSFVQAALEAGKPFVGFRLQAIGMDPTVPQLLIVRTAEFGEQNGFIYTPKLTLEFD